MKNYNIRIGILSFIILALLSGCQRQSEEIYRYYTSETENMMKNIETSDADTAGEDEPEVIDETTGELTVYVWHPQRVSFFGWIIKEFNKKYPNIQVSVNGQMEYYPTASDYPAKVSVDLMSGTAGDIIDLADLPYIRYARNNLLEDLYPYMEEDPNFQQEDYYTNIFEAIEYKDELYGIPMSFFNKSVRFSQTLLEKNRIEIAEMKSINYKDILNIYHRIAPGNDKLILTHYFDRLILEESEYCRFLDERNGTADFNSQEYIEFLNETKSIQWPSEEERKRLFISMEEAWASLDENDLCVFVASLYQKERNSRLFYEHPSNLTLPIPLSSTNGDKEFMSPDRVLSISSSSKNKDLAWKFIRFCIEEKPAEVLNGNDNWLLSGYPINRRNTLKMLESAFGEGKEEAIQMIDQWNSERNEANFLSHSYVLYDEIRKITDEFYGGRMTAEECARQAQERAEIYLKE